jgi:hypothetical protein
MSFVIHDDAGFERIAAVAPLQQERWPVVA